VFARYFDVMEKLLTFVRNPPDEAHEDLIVASRKKLAANLQGNDNDVMLPLWAEVMRHKGITYIKEFPTVALPAFHVAVDGLGLELVRVSSAEAGAIQDDAVAEETGRYCRELALPHALRESEFIEVE